MDSLAPDADDVHARVAFPHLEDAVGAIVAERDERRQDGARRRVRHEQIAAEVSQRHAATFTAERLRGESG